MHRPVSAIETKPNGAANGVAGLSPTDSAACRRLEDIERDVIVQTLRVFNGHRQKTARALGIGVRTLGLKLKKWKELQLVAESL
jgi:DNA-binding NtrC family response regulator